MKWVTRKNFRQLSRKQQYNRLVARRNFQQSFISDHLSSCNKNNHIQGNIENDDHYGKYSINKENVQIQQNQLVTPHEDRIYNDVSFNTVNDDYRLEEQDLIASIDDCLLDTHTNFQNSLRQCCIDMNINHNQIKALLQVLRTHKCFKNLPKDSRTLLKTGCNRITLFEIGSGVYWHLGFVETLQNHLSLYDDSEIPDLLEIELNTDGLSLSKSNPIQFWPIQYRIVNIKQFKPLIIGIYKGINKPSNVNKFFQSFISEVIEAKSLGGILFKNRRIPFVFRNFVGDAPARAFVLNHYGHNSTYPCSKCTVKGIRYENRIMVYLGINHEKRSDKKYIQQQDEDHQKPGKTPLQDLSIPPVTRVPFEIMHLVYLGVTVRLLEAWISGKFGLLAKLPSIRVNEISKRYELLNEWCPSDFARRPRALTKFGRFKATELKHFLLYAAPAILIGILPKQNYLHILMLNAAMRILTSNHSQNELNIAKKLLNGFVLYSEKLYTPAFVSYNVHALQHLIDDAKTFGPLHNCSAFIYENNMPLFRKNIRNHPRPLEQFANRLKEKNHIQHVPKKIQENYANATGSYQNDQYLIMSDKQERRRRKIKKPTKYCTTASENEKNKFKKSKIPDNIEKFLVSGEESINETDESSSYDSEPLKSDNTLKKKRQNTKQQNYPESKRRKSSNQNMNKKSSNKQSSQVESNQNKKGKVIYSEEEEEEEEEDGSLVIENSETESSKSESENVAASENKNKENTNKVSNQHNTQIISKSIIKEPHDKNRNNKLGNIPTTTLPSSSVPQNKAILLNEHELNLRSNAPSIGNLKNISRSDVNKSNDSQYLLGSLELRIAQLVENERLKLEEFINILLEKNKAELNEKLSILETKISNNRSSGEPSMKVPDGFPLQTLEDFDEFEANGTKQTELKSYFIWWGGVDPKSAVRQYLKDSIDDNIIKHFQWASVKDKENQDEIRPLYSTHLSRIIFGAIHSFFPNVTIGAYGKIIQSALRAAKQRNRDKNRREKLKSQELLIDPLHINPLQYAEAFYSQDGNDVNKNNNG